MARTVAGCLPRALALILLVELRRQGWLRPSARIPFDILDGPACPAALRGPLREPARLALFGPPGQGRMTDQKHREAVYQRLSAEILREGFDLQRLARVASRVMCDREVCADPILTGMLRSVISQRESDLRSALEAVSVADAPAPEPRESAETFSGFFTREQVRNILQRLQLKFDDQISHFEESGALDTLKAMRDLARRYPVHVEPLLIRHYEDTYAGFRDRCVHWRQTIEKLAKRGAEAGRNGDEQTANWVIRRLHAIHALRGSLLSEAHLEGLCRNIQTAEDSYEEFEAAESLLAREREIAAEIRQLAAAVRKFHEVARTHPQESPAFRVAAERYRKAVQEIQRHDQEWLTGVFMELEDLVSEMHDNTGEAEGQINDFVERLRLALVQMHKEIRRIHGEKLDQFSTPPEPPAPADDSE